MQLKINTNIGSLKKLIIFLLSTLFSTACQTHLPLVDEHNGNDKKIVITKPCPNNIVQIEQVELADIDYLLYANRMIDNMIGSEAVKEKLELHRLKISLAAIQDKNTTHIDMSTLNRTIKNRLLRSGQFIVVANRQASEVHLSGAFEKIEQLSTAPLTPQETSQQTECIVSYKQFSLQLNESQSKKLIWSDKKQFK